MPAITTYAKPVDGLVTIRIPDEYNGNAFEVLLFPVPLRSSNMESSPFSQKRENIHLSATTQKFGQEAAEMFDFLMSQHGAREEGFVFNREEANARR